MNHRRASSSLGCFLLFVLFPLCASAAPKDPCKLLQRDLDQQIDDLKAWQKLDLQECSRISGSDSDACRQLQDRHAQDLRMFRDNRAYQMANCRGPQRHTLAATSPFETYNHDLNDFYAKYYKNRGPCVEYPYVNCQQYDHYVHGKYHHHHHHYYTEPASGGAKSASAYTEKPSSVSATGHGDQGTKQGARVNDGSGKSAHRGSDRDNASNRGSSHDNSPNHGSDRSDSSSAAASHHSHDSSAGSYSGGSHASGGGSDSHASSSSGGSSSSGSSHSSGASGGGGSSSSGASSASSSSPPSSSGGAGTAASSPASSPSHDTGGSRPK